MHLASMPWDQYFCRKCLPNVGTHIRRYPKVGIKLGFISCRNSPHSFHSSWLTRGARKNLSCKEDKIFCQSLVAHNKSGSIKIYENEIEWAKFVVSNLPSFLEIEKQIYSLIFFCFVSVIWRGTHTIRFIVCAIVCAKPEIAEFQFEPPESHIKLICQMFRTKNSLLICRNNFRINGNTQTVLPRSSMSTWAITPYGAVLNSPRQVLLRFGDNGCPAAWIPEILLPKLHESPNFWRWFGSEFWGKACRWAKIAPKP